MRGLAILILILVMSVANADDGGSWILLKPLGAIVQLNIAPEKILENQFKTSSVEQDSNGYVVTVNGKVPMNLADNLGYSGAKFVQGNNITKITITTSPESVVANFLAKNLGTDVKVVNSAPVEYEIRTNTTKDALNALLAPVSGSVAPGDNSFVDGLTPDTVSLTKRIIDARLNRLGLSGTSVWILDSKFILVHIPGVDPSTAQDVVAGSPGKFEIRIQMNNNESMHVLYGDAVESVDIPTGQSNGGWGVPITLSEEGARIFQKAAIDSGATKNPKAHEISMYLGKDLLFSAPLSPEEAASLNKTSIKSMVAETGSGDAGSLKAKELYIHLSEGELPVNVKVIFAVGVLVEM